MKSTDNVYKFKKNPEDFYLLSVADIRYAETLEELARVYDSNITLVKIEINLGVDKVKTAYIEPCSGIAKGIALSRECPDIYYYGGNIEVQENWNTKDQMLLDAINTQVIENYNHFMSVVYKNFIQLIPMIPEDIITVLLDYIDLKDLVLLSKEMAQLENYNLNSYNSREEEILGVGIESHLNINDGTI